jgi:hypothetical protein
MWIVGGETFSHSKYMVATLTPDLKNEEVQGIWCQGYKTCFFSVTDAAAK